MLPKAANLKTFYETKVWRFHRIVNPYELIRSQNIVEFLAPVSSGLILDAGCGGGTYTEILAKTSNVIALDISKRALRIAKGNVGSSYASFIVSDLDHLPLVEKSLSGIICVDVVEHVTNVKQLFQEMSRVLEVSGRIAIFTACGENKLSLEYILKPAFGRSIDLIRSKMGHVQIFSTQSLCLLLSPSFTVTNIKYMHHWIGASLKFIWDLAHENSSKSHQSTLAPRTAVPSIPTRILWMTLETEYKLLKNKSSGNEIIVNAIKKPESHREPPKGV
jgi:SAM-dependent methyltransferase